MKGRAIEYSAAELAFIKRHSTLPRQQLSELFNAEFNRAVSGINLGRLCERKGWLTGRTGQFKKGQAPWNAGTKGQGLTGANPGSFKPGQPSINEKPVGAVRLDKEGYVLVKVALGRDNWVPKQRWLYEQYIGPIPPGCIVRFRDNDKFNFSLDNLELVTRRENAILNKEGYTQLPPELKPSFKLVVKLEIAQRDLMEGRA